MTGIIFLLGPGLILLGLLIAWVSQQIKATPVLMKLVFWVGIVLVFVGLVLSLAPVIVWLDTQFRAMLGTH